MKRGIRALGLDDGHLEGKRTPLVGVLMRPGLVEGVIVRSVEIHGLDATEQVLSMLHTELGGQARVILSSAIVFGGTNVLDPEPVSLPIIALTRKPPTEEFYHALARSPYGEKKLEIARKYEHVVLETERGCLHAFLHKIRSRDAKKIVERFQEHALVPEPVRLAHMIATAISLGESRGHA